MIKSGKKIVIALLSAALVSSVFVGCNKETKKTEEKTTANYTIDNNDYLVDKEWLKGHLDDKEVLLIDARADKEYKKGHIKGAINVAWQALANMTGKSGEKGWGVALDKDALSKKIGELGINKDKKVIVYANKDGWGEDGRIVWELKSAGINAKMLDGGADLWKKDNEELTKEEPKISKEDFTIEKIDDSKTITTEDLKKEFKDLKIVDSRAKDEFEGATKFGEARGGHLKDAISLPFNKVYNEDGSIKNKEELTKIFEEAGLKKDDKIVTYCTAGIRSAHLALILNLCGYNNVRNYDASFYEWAGDNSNEVVK